MSTPPPEGRKANTEVGRFSRLFTESEDWLMRRVLRYAKQRGFTRYTSTLEEAWRVSIAGLTESLIQAVESRGWDLELDADEDALQDPSTSWGILEAQKHRSRGVTLSMFLGLMKYYRQSYLDLVDETELGARVAARYRTAVTRFFDRVELGFCEEWSRFGAEDRVADLQRSNRDMTNEKNKYLTLFESLEVPVLLLDSEGAIANVNVAAAEAFSLGSVSGATYYSHEAKGERFEPLVAEIDAFVGGSADESTLERALETAAGRRHFQVSFKRLLDVSGKFTGLTLILTDVTDRKETEEALRSLSLRDDLTGLYNRRGFDALGRQLINMARRLDRTLAMIFLDLDGLKGINDTKGHQVGDVALQDVGRLLAETFRESDVIARLGGDEFGVLVAAEGDRRLGEAVERLQRGLRRGRFADTPDGEGLSVSVGVALCVDPERCELTDLIAEADERMYEHKQRRRRERSS